MNDFQRRFHFETEVWLSETREKVFSFFADARNLQRITPPWLNFRILTPGPLVMQKETRIDYRLRIHGLPIRWRSEISVWEPPLRFVDRQLKGPYRLWIHEHSFKEDDGGTTVCDRVEYDVFGGKLLNRFLIRPDLERIFRYRRETMVELFGG